MIIKSKSYKTTRSFASVLHYVFRENERDNGFVLTKFIKGKDLSVEELAQQLIFNEQFRVNKRKNNVRLYMDILSFHPRDAERLNNEKLHQIALKYLSLRAPKSIAIATVHKNEKNHTHLHICFSGVEYKTGKSIRISKDDFKNKVKLEMEKYQQEVFPELGLSKIKHEKSLTPKKYLKKENKKILEPFGEVSEKQKILKVLEETFTISKSQQDFYEKLEVQGFQLYSRNGRITGIQGNRKFRFKTLGYSTEVLRELDLDPTFRKRKELLQNIREYKHEKSKKHEL